MLLFSVFWLDKGKLGSSFKMGKNENFVLHHLDILLISFPSNNEGNSEDQVRRRQKRRRLNFGC